jgi:hypothetical protein
MPPAESARVPLRGPAVTGALTFMSHSLAPACTSIRHGRPWRSYPADLLDALLSAAAMGAIFGGLWPT